MVLDPAMQKEMEVGLGILLSVTMSPADVSKTALAIVSKLNVVLDRVAFEEYEQGSTESFEEFHLLGLAEAKNSCESCLESQMAIRIMAGICDVETKKKEAVSPQPLPNN